MNIINFEKKYNYNIFVDDVIKLSRLFTPFVKVESIGNSVDGREILLIRLGYGQTSVLFTAGVHGREKINPVVIMKIIENISLNNYLRSNKKFDSYSMIFIPVVNPDGFEIACSGYDAINHYMHKICCKSTAVLPEEYKYNAHAVDINRNFPSASYRILPHSGKFSGSEPETMALINVIKRENIMGYIDFHSRGECIYYYRNAMPEQYNINQLRLADKLSELSGYRIMNPGEEIVGNDSGGNTVHYFSEYTSRPAFTVETVSDDEKFPLRDSLYNSVLQQIGQLPMDFLNLVC